MKKSTFHQVIGALIANGLDKLAAEVVEATTLRLRDVKVYERTYKAFRFDNEKDANNFMEKNKGWGVIKSDKSGIWVAKNADTGKATSSVEDNIMLSNPRVVKTESNRRYTWDQRRKFTWVVVEYKGDDGHVYRKAFNFEKGMTPQEIDKHIPHTGKNKELSEISKKPIYK